MSAPHHLLRSVALAAAVLLLAVPVASAKKKPATTTTTTRTGKRAKTTTAKATAAPVGSRGKKCWSDLVKDWYSDGRIDKTYEVHCYRDALKHLPPDVKAYSDAYDVISRALSSATRGKPSVAPNTPIAPPSDQPQTTTSKTKTTTSVVGPGNGNDGNGPTATPPIAHLPGDRGASGVPVPLIVLGALALLLVAAGAAGLLVRRMQARRGGPGAAA